MNCYCLYIYEDFYIWCFTLVSVRNSGDIVYLLLIAFDVCVQAMFSEQTLQRGSECSSSHIKLVQHLTARPDALYMLEDSGGSSSATMAWANVDIVGGSVPGT